MNPRKFFKGFGGFGKNSRVFHSRVLGGFGKHSRVLGGFGKNSRVWGRFGKKSRVFDSRVQKSEISHCSESKVIFIAQISNSVIFCMNFDDFL